MSTHEWVMLIAVLLGGFWKLNRQRAKIEVALSGKVTYDECSARRRSCSRHKRR